MYNEGLIKRNILNFISLAICAVAIYYAIFTNGLENYSVDKFETVTACSIAIIALLVVKIFVPVDSLGPLGLIYNLVAIVLCMMCLYLMIMSRCELIGTIIFSSLDRSNPAAIEALTTGAIAFGGYGVCAFTTAINGFIA